MYGEWGEAGEGHDGRHGSAVAMSPTGVRGAFGRACASVRRGVARAGAVASPGAGGDGGDGSGCATAQGPGPTAGDGMGRRLPAVVPPVEEVDAARQPAAARTLGAGGVRHGPALRVHAEPYVARRPVAGQALIAARTEGLTWRTGIA